MASSRRGLTVVGFPGLPKVPPKDFLNEKIKEDIRQEDDVEGISEG